MTPKPIANLVPAPPLPTEKEAQDAANQILLTPPTLKVVFLGQELTIKPLPIAYSQKLSNAILPVRIQAGQVVSELSAKIVTVQNEKASVKERQAAAKQFLDKTTQNLETCAEIDTAVANAVVDAAAILAEFYGITTTKEKINEKATLPEVIKLVNAQLEVNSDEDFLLRPFTVFMRAFLGTGDIESRSLDLLSILASVNVGK